MLRRRQLQSVTRKDSRRDPIVNNLTDALKNIDPALLDAPLTEDKLKAREITHPPRILMLTARDTVEDRIRGLDVGADDYLVKPFAFDELSARIRSLLRRDPGRSGAVLEVGDVVLDTARHRARRNDRDLDLTAKEFALLRYFMSRPGEVVSQEVLLDHVWDEHADPFTNTVRVTVGTLRRKLSMDGEEALLETVVGSGYRLLDGDDVR